MLTQRNQHRDVVVVGGGGYADYQLLTRLKEFTMCIKRNDEKAGP